MQLPRKSWDKATAGPVAESILAWAKTVPADKRTAQDFVETTQTGIEMASLLPAADATRLRKELRGLGVSVFVVKTVREQMRYDTTRLVVEVGKPFEVIMENLDAMPHNLVFVEPGTRQSVAESVATMPPDKLDSRGRPYLPPNDKRVLNATKLLEPGQKETIRLIAPATEGEYEYVCTFPGHWQNMYGTLIVTKDVDAYLQAHPVAHRFRKHPSRGRSMCIPIDLNMNTRNTMNISRRHVFTFPVLTFHRAPISSSAPRPFASPHIVPADRTSRSVNEPDHQEDQTPPATYQAPGRS